MTGPVARKLASAQDFSPTHFDEPQSDGPLPSSEPRLPPAHQPSAPLSPMVVDREVQGSVATPLSSPISQNPLLQQVPLVVQLSSPSRRSSQSLRTRDSTAAWATADGLLPIREGFTAPGYVPAPVVGGITYTVHTTPERSPPAIRPNTQSSGVGRRLFSEYGGPQLQGSPQGPDLLQQSAYMGTPGQRQLPVHSVCRYELPFCAYILTLLLSSQRASATERFQRQQLLSQIVRRHELLFLCIYRLIYS